MEKKHILIIEDEDAIVEILTIKLEEVGFRVSRERNGKDGLKALAKGDVDLLILDLLMPVMNGFKTLEEMKKKDLMVPTIVLTNLGQREDMEQVTKYDGVDYLVKSDTPLAEIADKVKSKL